MILIYNKLKLKPINGSLAIIEVLNELFSFAEKLEDDTKLKKLYLVIFKGKLESLFKHAQYSKSDKHKL